MSRGFAGDGGAPPPTQSGGGFSRNDPMYGFYEPTEKKTKEGKPISKRIKTWYVPPGGKDKPCIVLDRNTGPRFSLKLHEFTGPDGKRGSMVRAINQKEETRGDPVEDALGKEARWYWCLTVIDLSTFTPKTGKNAGTTYSHFRRLLLVPNYRYEDMAGIEEKDPDGWHGRRFLVSRDEDQKSSKIGTLWYPDGKLTDDELKAECEKAAESYGIPVDQYIEPFDYAALLKSPTYEEALKIAGQIKGTGSGGSQVPEGDTQAIRF